jgi:hypothetical protein
MSLETFIPTELTIAPDPPGQFDHLILKTIPVDVFTSFELWSPMLNATLQPEEAAFLQSDRSRLEAIGARLIWLLNATCVEGEKVTPGKTIHHWQEIIETIAERGFHFDAIEVIYQPQVIRSPNLQENNQPTWLIHPNRWQFNFIELKTVENGFQPQVIPVSLLISFGRTIVKTIRNAAA